MRLQLHHRRRLDLWRSSIHSICHLLFLWSETAAALRVLHIHMRTITTTTTTIIIMPITASKVGTWTSSVSEQSGRKTAVRTAPIGVKTIISAHCWHHRARDRALSLVIERAYVEV